MSTFAVGDIVYLRASAARGFLESYRITQIRNDGVSWIYGFEVAKRTPHISTVGFMNTLTQDTSFEQPAEELTDFCSALQLAINYHTTRLSELQALQSRCT